MISKQIEINVLWCIIYYLKTIEEHVQIDQFWVSRGFYTHSILFFGTMRAVRRETESDRPASKAGVARPASKAALARPNSKTSDVHKEKKRRQNGQISRAH